MNNCGLVGGWEWLFSPSLQIQLRLIFLFLKLLWDGWRDELLKKCSKNSKIPEKRIKKKNKQKKTETCQILIGY